MKSPAKVENTILRMKRKLELKNKNKALKPKMHCVSEFAAKKQIVVSQSAERLMRKPKAA